MPKDLGKVEQAIMDSLRRLRGYVLNPPELAKMVFEVKKPTVSQLVSVRRALRALHTAGLIERTEDSQGRRAAFWKLKTANRRKAKHEQQEQEREEMRDQLRPKKPKGDLVRMIAILGMLGSAHDGEIASAGRKAEALRIKLGLTWSQILQGPE
jgi:hypothetical protein